MIDAICAVIAERGYENTRFTDVATRAGRSIGSLQYMFGSREDMIVVALEEKANRYVEEATARAEAIADPIDRLRWVATYLAAGVGDDAAWRLEWLVWTEYWRAALRDDDLRADSATLYRRWIELVRDCIERCIDAAACAAPEDLDAVAAGAVAIGDGLGIQISLGHPSMTRPRAGAVVRASLAAKLGCPALADPPRSDPPGPGARPAQ